MKKIVLILFITIISFCLLTACGQDKQSEKVKTVEQLIDSIGDVSLDSETVIKFVDSFYNTLSEQEKEEVANIATLNAAKETLSELKTEKEEADEKAKQLEAEEKEAAAKRAKEAEEKKEADRIAAEEAARKAEEERKAMEDSIPPAPIAITNIRTESPYSALNVYAQFTNTGDVNIEAFSFYVRCYNAYGDVVKAYGNQEKADCYFDDVLKAKATTRSDWYWTLYGFGTAANVEVAIYKYKLNGQETVTIPDSKLVWVKQK